LGRQFIPTEDGLYFSIDCVYPIQDIANPYLGKTGRTACMLEFKGKWIQYLPLVEFAYNNSFQATIGMAPYEALYGWKCRSPL
jgi:hypothetical protein